MARHNRDGEGEDQRAHGYDISYQPDWLRLVKVTRALESGRQSTKILFRNPAPREQRPGKRVRTRIRSKEQGLDFEIVVNDPKQVVTRVIVETAPSPDGEQDPVVFTLEDRNPPPERR